MANESGLIDPTKPVGIIGAANQVATQKYVPTVSYQDQAKALYKNYLGREGEQAGVDYWANELAKNSGNVDEAFKVAAKQNYGDTLTNKNSQWDEYSGNVIAKDLNGTIAQGAGNSQWQPQYVQKEALKPEIYNNLYAGDLLGTNKYNETFGGGKPIMNNQGQLNREYELNKPVNPNVARGDKLLPTLGSFNKGIDPYAVYQAAGLKTPVGAYNEGKWNANYGASGDQIVNDTLEQKAGRVKALMAAGLTLQEAQAEAENGFRMQGDAQGAYEGRAGGVGIIGDQASGQSSSNPYSPIQNYQVSPLGAPSQWNVNPNQTMEGRINSLIDPNSPLIAQARANAKMQMNERGLLNSSMAMTAADAAAYQAALPIAQNDAATEAKAAGYNTDMRNQFAVQNFGAENSLQQALLGANTTLQNTAMNNAASSANAKLSADTQLRLSDKDAQTKMQMAATDEKTRINLANIDAATRTRLSETEANYKNVLQTNQSAANIYQQTTQNIAAIQTSSLSSEAKSQAIANLEAKLKESLSVLGAISGMNLGDLVSVSNPSDSPASYDTPNANRYGSLINGSL